MTIEDLINKLSNNLIKKTPLENPYKITKNLLMFSVFYYILLQIFLGYRDDISEKATQPIFILEFLLILSLLISSLFSLSLSCYPDYHQKYFFTKIPQIIIIITMILFVAKIFIEENQAIQNRPIHNIECFICVILSSIIPSIYFFAKLKKGYSINYLRSLFFSIISAGSFSLMALRISEKNDSDFHIIFYHYSPIILILAVGILFVNNFLKKTKS